MRKLVTFRVVGLEVVPWSVPTIGNTITRTGKRVRFARRTKKSRLSEGKSSLEDWQRYVRHAAEKAIVGTPLADGAYLGPVRLHLDFYARTPKGRRHGELWTVGVEWSEAKQSYVKKSARGKPEADLVNLFKGTEDALQPVIFGNDVQSRMISASAWYGPHDGVQVVVYAIEPHDFPGYGEVI